VGELLLPRRDDPSDLSVCLVDSSSGPSLSINNGDSNISSTSSPFSVVALGSTLDDFPKKAK
jgi:hypothetical protein